MRVVIAIFTLTWIGCTSLNRSEQNEIIVGENGAHFRYWQQGEGDQAQIMRARCDGEAPFTTDKCKLDEASVELAKFKGELEQFVYTDFVPYVEMSIGNLKFDEEDITAEIESSEDEQVIANLKNELKEVELTRRSWENAIKYMTAMKKQEKDLLAAIKSKEIFSADDENSEIAHLHVPVFFVAKAFSKARGDSVNARFSGVRALAWTKAGGTVQLSFTKDKLPTDLKLDNQLCWQNGKALDGTVETIFTESKQAVCCLQGQAEAWQPDRQSVTNAFLSGDARCGEKDRCLKINFLDQSPDVALHPEIICRLNVANDLLYLEDLVTVFGDSVVEWGATL